MSADSRSTLPVRPNVIPIFPNDVSQPSSSSVPSSPQPDVVPEDRADGPADAEENFGEATRISNLRYNEK